MPTTMAAFFDRYRKAFEAYDLDALCPLIHLPCLIGSGPDLLTVTDAGDLRTRLGRQFERHRELDFADASFEVLHHRRLEPRYLVADVRWRFFLEGGEPLMTFGVHYALTAPESGWKIACVLPLDLTGYADEPASDSPAPT